MIALVQHARISNMNARVVLMTEQNDYVCAYRLEQALRDALKAQKEDMAFKALVNIPSSGSYLGFPPAMGFTQFCLLDRNVGVFLSWRS